jgi:hypothetical protein
VSIARLAAEAERWHRRIFLDIASGVICYLRLPNGTERAFGTSAASRQETHVSISRSGTASGARKARAGDRRNKLVALKKDFDTWEATTLGADFPAGGVKF